MKDKQIIKSYFENYYPSNNKYIYNEDWGIGALIFLFLIFLMTKTFSSEETPEIISKKIDDDPHIPEKIIKNLDNVKKILIQHNPGQNLKEVLDLLDYIDDNLNELKKHPNDSKRLISAINDQLIKFLEYILKLYSNQHPSKKNILFIELNKILTLFGLSEIFRTLLKTANDNNQITKDNSTEKVKVTSFKDLGLEEEPEEQGESDGSILNYKDEDDDEEEQINLDDPVEESNDDEDVFKNKSIEQIRKEIQSKQNLINNMPNDIKKIYNYIIKDFSKYTEQEIKYLHVILQDISGFEDEFRRSDIFQKALESIEDEQDLVLNKKPYDKLLELLQKNNIFIRKYQESFWIKIDIDKYKIRKIKPLKNGDTSQSFYYMYFVSNSEEFKIKIREDQKEKYRLYDLLTNFSFVLNENIEDDNFLNSTDICNGEWGYDDITDNIEIKINNYTIGFNQKKINEHIKNTKTFIGKESGKIIKQLINPQNSDPTPTDRFYYCIKDDDNYFIIEIKNNFLSSIKEIYNKKYFKYKTTGIIGNYQFNDKEDLKDLILIDYQSGKIHKFLIKMSNIKKNEIDFDDLVFSKANKSAIKLVNNIINLDKSKGNWLD